jgi:hypothetical protein
MHQLGQSIGAFVQQVNILLHREFCAKRKPKNKLDKRLKGKEEEEEEEDEGQLS